MQFNLATNDNSKWDHCNSDYRLQNTWMTSDL